MKKRLVIICGGTQAHYTSDIIEKESKYEIIGIIDSKAEINSYLYGYKVLGRQEDINDLIGEYNIECGIIAIGDNYNRLLVKEAIENRTIDFEWVNAIHPSCTIAKDVEIGVGITMMARCIVNTGAKLGDFSNYFTGCQVEHNCEISDFASISAGVVLGGYVKVGKFSAICLNCTVFDRIDVGTNVIVGSGSLLTKHLCSDCLVYGNPAKHIKDRKLGEKYLK